MSEHESWDELLAGYALDALEPDEVRRLVEHSAGCAACGRTLRDFQDVAADLARALPYSPPPPGGKARLMAAIAVQRAAAETPPTTMPAAVPAPVQRDAGERQPDQVRRVPAGPSTGRPGGRSDATRPGGRGPRGRRRLVGSMSRALTAAAVVLALVVGGAVYGWQQHGLADRRASRLAAAERMLRGMADGARTVSLGSGQGATGQIVQKDGQLWVLADGLQPNDTATSTYVLWATATDGHMAAVTTFDVPKDKFVALDAISLPKQVRPQPAFAISRENGRTAPAVPSVPVLSSEA